MSESFDKWYRGQPPVKHLIKLECANVFEAGYNSRQAEIDSLQSMVNELRFHGSLLNNHWMLEDAGNGNYLSRDYREATIRGEWCEDSTYYRFKMLPQLAPFLVEAQNSSMNTKEQSLEAHDNTLIEKCAKACESRLATIPKKYEYRAKLCAVSMNHEDKKCAELIRELKHE